MMIIHTFQSLLSLVIILLAEATLSDGNIIDVTYEELETLNATCGHLDNCKKERSKDDIPEYNCICGEFCSLSNTCCVDSKFRKQYFKSRNMHNCVTIYGDRPNSVYMVDSCDPSWNGDKFVEELCRSNGEDFGDLFLLAPVTNPTTRATYKNYFCSVCNGNNDDGQLVFWTLSLSSRSSEVMNVSASELRYDSKYRRWTIGDASEALTTERLNVKFLAPDELTGFVYDCLQEMISDCAPDWVDTSIKEKCQAYMALLSVKRGYRSVRYRNPHCAICNFEQLENRTCVQEKEKSFGAWASNTFFVRLFSLYDKDSKCEDGMVYDTIAKKCRRVFKG